MKIIQTLAIASLFSLAAVGTALAGDGDVSTFTDSGTVAIGTPTMGVKPSKNTFVRYKSGTTIENTSGVATYSLSAYHGSGTKTYGSSSGDTKIFMIDGTGVAPVDAPAVGGSAPFGDGYTAL